MTTLISKLVRDVMSSSFLDYSMSVITDRALPDVRDGLKPVHRRILYAMSELGNTYNRPYKKSARVVGDVIGKYHPHGDSSVYGAIVRMAQNFTMSAPLVDGQGNFGSIDGDNPAAMRYTEVRLTRIAGEMFGDLHKETISYRPNYDGSEKEPEVLTVPYPNLLVNGVEGIAVGMACCIPPHNLRAVVDATLHLMDNSDASVADIVGILQAPDFPTAGIVHGLDGFAEAVESGRGRIKIRSRWHEEDRPRGGKAIVIDELPYQVNKADLVAKIAELVSLRQIEGIAELRDESNKEGIRIWIGLKKDESPEAIFSQLVSKTAIEESISYNCTVLCQGRPKLLGLREIIKEWLQFREEVVLARHIFERKQALARLHILEGFMAALAQLDAVIKTIRESESAPVAKSALMALLQVDEGQAQAILDLRLQKLTGMELDSIRNEHAQVNALVAELTSIIEDPQRIRAVIREELKDISGRYGSERRTEIGHGISDITREDLIAREDVLIAMTQGGYIKRMPVNVLSRQNRGTRGKKAVEVGDEDSISFMSQSHSHDSLMVFARNGQVYGIKAYRIPEAGLGSKGRHIRNVIEGLDQEISAVLALPEHDPALSVLTVTKSGQVKRSSIEDYSGATRRGGIRGVGLDVDDELLASFAVREGDHLMLVANTGKAIRFDLEQVRVMGRAAGGVRGIKLDEGEFLVGAAVVPAATPEEADKLYLLCVGEQGVGKRTPVSDFPTQGRAGQGVIAFKANTKTGNLVTAMAVTLDQDLIMLSSNGVSNRIAVKDIRETGRAASGVFLMNIDSGQRLVSATTVLHSEEEEGDSQDGAQDVAGQHVTTSVV